MIHSAARQRLCPSALWFELIQQGVTRVNLLIAYPNGDLHWGSANIGLLGQWSDQRYELVYCEAVAARG